MQIVFDREKISFDLVDADLAPIYQQMVKHLRHIDIPFRPWDNPYVNLDPVSDLIEYGKKVGVTVDRALCDQEYFNMLHTIYEKNYNGDPAWLDFHECIHIYERSRNTSQPNKYLHIDYREKTGLLEKSFDHSWLKKSTRQIKAGDVFVNWAELGKIPYVYWRNNEPNDIDRIKELCKPWLKLRPKILVAMNDYDYTIVSPEFDHWWAQYHDEWCRHWHIPKWDLDDMMSVLIFGKVPDDMLKKLEKLLVAGGIPTKISL